MRRKNIIPLLIIYTKFPFIKIIKCTSSKDLFKFKGTAILTPTPTPASSSNSEMEKNSQFTSPTLIRNFLSRKHSPISKAPLLPLLPPMTRIEFDQSSTRTKQVSSYHRQKNRIEMIRTSGENLMNWIKKQKI